MRIQPIVDKYAIDSNAESLRPRRDSRQVMDAIHASVPGVLRCHAGQCWYIVLKTRTGALILCRGSNPAEFEEFTLLEQLYICQNLPIKLTITDNTFCVRMFSAYSLKYQIGNDVFLLNLDLGA